MSKYLVTYTETIGNVYIKSDEVRTVYRSRIMNFNGEYPDEKTLKREILKKGIAIIFMQKLESSEE